jgi:Holliday junction resolvasome RuvABC endonuclease subunit
MKRILAIDPGTQCGWSLFDERTVTGGTWDLSARRHEGGGMRYVHFKRHLREIGRVDLVAYEEVRRHMGVDAAHVYGGLIAHLGAWCEENDIPYTAVPVGTIKKFATGNGNASKEAMIEACAKKLKIVCVDDNQADATWILHFILKREGVR